MSAPAPGRDDPVDRLRDRLDGVRRRGSGWQALCPAHDDRNPSLSIDRTEDGQALVRCHAGCQTEDVVAAVGLRMADLYADGQDRPRDQWRRSGRPVSGARPRLKPVPPPVTEQPASGGSQAGRRKGSRRQQKLGPVVASYPYRDESGQVLFTKTRHEPKTFRVRRPDGSWNIGDARRVLYRLPELIAALQAGQTVYVVEGEKDADRLAALGVAATCNFDGAGKWASEYSDALDGAHVVIVRDLDQAGAKHALLVFDSLAARAASVRIVEPVTTREHGDVSDHLAAGHSLDDLVEVDPATLREPQDPEPEGGDLPNLPEEFWAARPVLTHIRQAAHARNRCADVLFYSLLARMSAMRLHTLTVDSGVGSPASLNLLVCPVGRSGSGKTSGISGTKRLMPAPPGLDLLDGPLGSGEGIAEAFMGVAEEPAKTGKRPRTVRKQVRHNAMLSLDEGQTLTKTMERSGATVGPALRSVFSGETLGQLNGKAESTRLARDYALGIVIGFQPSTIIPLLDDAEGGTPQRFLYCSATDPSIPVEPVEDPGPLDFDVATIVAPPTDVIGFVDSLRAEIRAADHANATGRAQPALLDSHEMLTRIKVAALLALLDERYVVNEEDWALALTVWRTSCAVRDRLVREAHVRAAEREWARRRSYAEDQVEATAAVEDHQVVRVAKWIARNVDRADGEPLKPFALRKRAAGRDRPVFETAVDYAEAQRWVSRDADGALCAGTSRPAEGGA